MKPGEAAIVGAAETTELGRIPDLSVIGLHTDAALNALGLLGEDSDLDADADVDVDVGADVDMDVDADVGVGAAVDAEVGDVEAELGEMAAEGIEAEAGAEAEIPEEVQEIDIYRLDWGIGTAQMKITNVEWQGEPARLAVMRDITDYKRKEEKLEMERKAQQGNFDDEMTMLQNKKHELQETRKDDEAWLASEKEKLERMREE